MIQDDPVSIFVGLHFVGLQFVGIYPSPDIIQPDWVVTCPVMGIRRITFAERIEWLFGEVFQEPVRLRNFFQFHGSVSYLLQNPELTRQP